MELRMEAKVIGVLLGDDRRYLTFLREERRYVGRGEGNVPHEYIVSEGQFRLGVFLCTFLWLKRNFAIP